MKKIYRIVVLMSGLMACQFIQAQSTSVFEEVGGVVAFEAEDYFSQEKSTVRKWYVIGDGSISAKPDPDGSHAATASGKKYMEILPDTRVKGDSDPNPDPLIPGENFSANSGVMGIINYKVYFNTPGKYYVWVRLYSSGPEDNGLHTGINNTWPATGERMQWCDGKNNWTWESKQRREPKALHCGVEKEIYVNVPTAGLHTVQFSMREDGVEIDKIVLSQAYTKPTGTGPAVKIKGGGVVIDPDPDPNTCANVSLGAITKFTNIAISGFSPAYKDAQRNALAIDASQYKDKFAAASTTFAGVTGKYDITINTLSELDGESTYRVKVNGVQIGTFKNPTTTVDYKPASQTFPNVDVKNGDVIQVEFNSHSNGKVPENGAFAFSRGRWTSLDFKCLGGNNTGIVGPPGYTYVADEKGTVDVSGTVNIAYGNNGTYVYLMNQTADVPCTNTAFGSDPTPGVKKYCFVKSNITAVNSVESNVLTAHPNPSNDGKFFLSEVLRYEIFNGHGIEVMKGVGDIVNLSEFPQGIYILKSGTQTIKLVK